MQKRKMRRNIKKVEDREEKSGTISIKPSDTNADVTNQVFIMCDSIVKHIRCFELSQRVENCRLLKAFLLQS